MQAKADAQLLREYSSQGSDAAFGEIVARYTNFVYATVMRQVGSAEIAEDVAQMVFTDLARKAAALAGKVDDHGTIVGWLYQSSRFALSKHLRAEQRRHLRESRAMQEFDPTATAATATDWDRVRPVLDQALADLGEEDRQAMLLRFFQNQGFQAVGASLGISDDAAQKRVGRALEKLRANLARHGITTTAALLSTVLSTHAVESAPSGLAAKLAGASLAGAAAKTGASLTLITMTSFKTGIVASGLAAALAVGLVVQNRSKHELQNENEALRQQINAAAQTASAPATTSPDDLDKQRRDHEELVKLRAQVAVLNNAMQKKDADLAAAKSIGKMAEAEVAKVQAEERERAQLAYSVNTLKQVGVAIRIYANDNGEMIPTNFSQLKNELGSLNFDRDAFELLNYGGPLSTTNISPSAFLGQLKQPMQRVDGRYNQVYLLVDGSVQQAISDTPDFTAWQQKFQQQTAADQAARAGK